MKLNVENMELILERIYLLRAARGWTEYQLAEMAGLPQSTISSWYRKRSVPSVASLTKICDAFDITLSQLFSTDETVYDLTEEQRILLRAWTSLIEEQQSLLLQFLSTL